MMNRSKKVGRPTKPTVAGERMSLGLKVTAEIKDRLDRAAQLTGRTQSQEAELRLERSFDRNDLLSEALALAYGPQLAGLLICLGKAMEHTGRFADAMTAPGVDRTVPGRPNARVRDLAARSPEAWIDNPYAFDQAVKSAVRTLESARPKGDVKAPAGSVAAVGEFEAFGEFSAYSLLLALSGEIWSSHLTAEEVDMVTALLKHIAGRMKDYPNPLKVQRAADDKESRQ